MFDPNVCFCFTFLGGARISAITFTFTTQALYDDVNHGVSDNIC